MDLKQLFSDYGTVSNDSRCSLNTLCLFIHPQRKNRPLDFNTAVVRDAYIPIHSCPIVHTYVRTYLAKVVV